MTEETLPLAELLAKAGDGEFLRSAAEAVLRDSLPNLARVVLIGGNAAAAAVESDSASAAASGAPSPRWPRCRCARTSRSRAR